MKLSDYVADFLSRNGVDRVFGMSGGAAVHLFDSIDRHPGMQILSMTHEQCAAIAADGYARATGGVGAAVTTSGPGATNLLTGTCCSFYDSIPTIMLTGQVATHRLKGARPVRQMGFQETDVVSIFRPVTKYAVQLSRPDDIRRELEQCLFWAQEGRPGPVLLDIPDDLQRAEVDPESMPAFVPPARLAGPENLDALVDRLLEELAASRRPVLVLGGGVKTPPLGPELLEFVEKLGVPVLTSWAGVDLIPAHHPVRVGPFGVYGPRAGNFAVQNADYVFALGTRLSQNLTGAVLPSFARQARIAVVDVDPGELDKFDGRGLVIGLKIRARAGDFLQRALPRLATWSHPDWSGWKEKIRHWQQSFPRDLSPRSSAAESSLDAGTFIGALSKALPEDALVFVDTGGNLTWTCNHILPKKGLRLFSAWNNTPMGYALPAAIGAGCAPGIREVTCIIGDGGLMLCLGELATAVRQALRLRIFLINNHSHGIQKQTLETWLGGRYVGVDPASGLAFPPDFNKVGEAMGLPSVRLDRNQDLDRELQKIYQTSGPVFVNVEINPDEKLYPVLKFGSALEDQLPSLPREAILSEMLIPPYSPPGNPAHPGPTLVPGW